MAGLDERVSFVLDVNAQPAISSLQEAANRMGGLRVAGEGATKGVADLGSAFDALKQHATAAMGPVGGLMEMMGKAGPWAIAASGLLAVAEATHEFIKAGIEAQKIETDLRAAVTNATGSWAKYSETVEATVAAVTKGSRFDNTGVEAALERMVTLTGNLAESEALLPAVADLAAARHMELGQSAEVVARFIEGSTQTFRRYGVVLSAATTEVLRNATESERAAIAQDLLNEKFGGRALSDLSTYQGGIAKLKADMHDLSEEIGKNMLSAITEMGDAMGSALTKSAAVQGILTGYKELGKGIAETARDIRVALDPGGAMDAATSKFKPEPGEDPFTASKREAYRVQGEIDIAGAKKNQDDEKARVQAIKDAEAYAAKLDALTMTGKAAGEQFRLMEDAIARVNARFGDAGAGVLAFTDDVLKMGKSAQEKGVDLGAMFAAQFRLAEQIKLDQSTQQDAQVAAFQSNEQLLEQQTKFADLAERNAAKVREYYFALDEGAKHAIETLAKLGPAGAPAAADIAFRLAQSRAFIGPLTPEQESENKRLAADSNRAGVETAKQEAKILTDAWKRIFEQYRREVVDPTANLFEDLATTGGQNLGEILASSFVSAMKSRSGDIAEMLLSGLAGGQIQKTEEGKYTFPGNVGSAFTSPREARDAQFKQSPRAQAAGVALQAGGGFASSYNQKGETDTQSAIGAAAAGYSVALALASTGYGVIAGIIVAAATYAGHLFQPSPKQEEKYAILGTDKFGRASVSGNENVDKNQQAQWLGQFQQTVDTFYNGYLKVLLKFPDMLLPKIDKAFAPVVGYFERGADLGFDRSPHFEEELDRYFKEGLPKQISGRFAKYMESAFVSVGFSVERFGEIWAKLSTLDPKKALELWGTLADGAVAIDKYMKLFKTPMFSPADALLTAGGATGGASGIFKQVTDEMNQTFGDALYKTDQGIIDLAASLGQLTGEDQINAFRDVSQQMAQRYEKEKQYIQGIANQIDAITSSYQSQMQNYTLLGMKKPDGTADYEAQAKYLRDQTNGLFSELSSASSPEAVTRIYNRIAGNVDKIYQTGSQQGPEAEKAYREWAMRNLTKAEEAAIAREHELAEKVDSANKAFVKAIEGFIKAFETATEKLTGGAGDQPGGGDSGGGGPGDDKSRTTSQKRSIDPTTGAPTADYVRAIEATIAALSPASERVVVTGGVTNAILSRIEAILANGRDIKIVVDDGGGDQRAAFRGRTAASR